MTMTLSVREMRMVAERILLQTALPQGFVPWVRDAVMISAALGLGGFGMLERVFPALKTARADALRILEEGPGALRLDAGGQHAWVLAAPLLDLATDLALRTGHGLLCIRNLADPAELRVTEAFAGRQGVRAVVTETRDETCLLALPGVGQQPDAMLDRLRRRGLEVDADLWWSLYALSAGALTPDSILSRRHAGPVIVEADGRVIGRKDTDDDTDLSMLGQAQGGNP